MNTREIAEEYRLSHWARIMQERQESGLSIKAFCRKAGFHENRYFYWQKRIREAACGEPVKAGSESKALTSIGFTEIKLAGQHDMLPAPSADSRQNQVCIDASGIRITAGGEYPADKLAALLQEVMRPC
jgi:hypothetical protein